MAFWGVISVDLMGNLVLVLAWMGWSCGEPVFSAPAVQYKLACGFGWALHAKPVLTCAFGRAPREAGAGAIHEALPKAPSVRQLYNLTFEFHMVTDDWAPFGGGIFCLFSIILGCLLLAK
uniref:Uncharacterized protein n=1 Tax=Setaria viridis TaxID=4556 RepID=A0A4U6TL65_SETVI|nr:hypothetical protein SEVIR_7G011310v2 [Setaria viridis]